MHQLELFPSMPAGRCSLCRSASPRLADCAKCVFRRAAVDAARPFPEERAAGRRAQIAATAARLAADKPRRDRIARLGALGRPVRVALVGCGASKRPGRHAARQLYTGSLFRASLAHAERWADDVVILSALHGLVDPAEQLDAYNLRLESYRQSEREQWAARVMAALGSRYAGLAVEFVIYAGASYADAVEHGLRWCRLGFRLATAHTPLEGLGVGERLAWLKRNSDPTAPAPTKCRRCKEVIPSRFWTKCAARVCGPCMRNQPLQAPRCRTCRQRRADVEAERCADCRARAERRAAERAERAAARATEARARRDRQLQRQIKRAENERRSEALNRDAMARYAAEQRAGERAPLAMHCGGFVAAAGVLYTSAEYAALETRPRGGYTPTAAQPSTEAP